MSEASTGAHLFPFVREALRALLPALLVLLFFVDTSHFLAAPTFSVVPRRFLQPFAIRPAVPERLTITLAH